MPHVLIIARSSSRGAELCALALAIGALAASPALAAAPNPHAEIECTFCHAETPRFGVDTRDTVSFWSAEGDEPALCERCHRPEENLHPLGVVPGDGRLGTQPPERLPLGKSEAVRGQVVCTSCHFLHAANADFALLRGFPGSDRPRAFRTWQDLCRECHRAGLERRSPHGGDDRACAFCHSVRPQAGRQAGVTPVGRKLCEFCHGVVGEEHFAGVNPFRSLPDCTGCHDPHSGKDRPARLRTGYLDPIREAVTLNPHHKRVLCFACHGEAKPGPLEGAATVAVCRRCHGSAQNAGVHHPLTKVPAGYAIPQGWPLADGAMTCVTCHAPGHPPGVVADHPDETEKLPHLLRGAVPGERNAICFRCHARSQWAERSPHEEAARTHTGCTLCHAADPEEGDTESFVADIVIVCLACHNVPDHPAEVRHTVTLKAGMQEKPSLPLGPGRRVTCATCHDPHLESPAGHRLRSGGAENAFCSQCHSF